MINVTEEWLMPLNIAAAAVLILSAVMGWKKGFLHEAVGLIGTAVSLLGSWLLSEVLSRYIMLWPEKWIPENAPALSASAVQFLNRICWVVVLYIFFRLLFMIISHATKGLQKVPVIHELSAMAGGLMGLAEGCITIVICTLILNMPVFAGGAEAVDATIAGPVRDMSMHVLNTYGMPLLQSKQVAELYSHAEAFTETELDALEQWLIEHGYGTEGTAENAE